METQHRAKGYERPELEEIDLQIEGSFLTEFSVPKDPDGEDSDGSNFG